MEAEQAASMAQIESQRIAWRYPTVGRSFWIQKAMQRRSGIRMGRDNVSNNVDNPSYYKDMELRPWIVIVSQE
jgi:hypothetical protein